MEKSAKTRKERAPAGLMLQYLVVLSATEPLVWRRILVPASYSFWDLHVAIQDAMGWQDAHLHEFHVVDPSSGTLMRLGIPDPDFPDERRVTPGWSAFPLDFITTSQFPIEYTYDFGDDWRHTLIFEGFEQRDKRRRPSPECLGGQGACPPEDCGGAHQYRELLTVLADPGHPEYDQWIEWTGGPIDPSAFSISSVRFDDPKKRWRAAFEEGVS